MNGVKLFIFLAFVLKSVTAQGGNIAAAAAAPAPGGADCNCQCISLQYIDSYGRRHGNCASTIYGGQWCYVKYDRYSPCYDKAPSQRFYGKYWSRHACATPPQNSPVCQYINPLPYGTSSTRQSSANVADNVY